jgi:hypothetical protein
MTDLQTRVAGHVALTALSVLVFGRSAFACPGNRPAVALPRQAAPIASSAATPQRVDGTFVGVWQVTYSVGGSPWDMSFDTWHADGTENDNDITPPLMSAVCEGVWQLVGPWTAALHHVGWAWDVTGFNLIGPFVLVETNTLSVDRNHYNGTFSLQQYDMSGSLDGSPITGTIAATRITVH